MKSEAKCKELWPQLEALTDGAMDVGGGVGAGNVLRPCLQKGGILSVAGITSPGVAEPNRY